MVLKWFNQMTSKGLLAQRLKHLPAMQETWVPTLGQEDPLEKEMANQSSILAWKIPWTEEPGGLQSTGSQRVRHDWATSPFTFCVYRHQKFWRESPTEITSTEITSEEVLWYSAQVGMKREVSPFFFFHFIFFTNYVKVNFKTWLCITFIIKENKLLN